LPNLKPSLWTVARPVVPCVWSCSECQAEFDLGPQSCESLTKKQIDQINRQFAIHCKRVHPASSPVFGLECPA